MRLPFFYGWIIVAVTFVTMAIGVNARTSFSLFFPPIIDEFGWERGVTAGAFSFGFLVSAIVSPLIGRMMDRFGPRAVMELGVALMARRAVAGAADDAAMASVSDHRRAGRRRQRLSRLFRPIAVSAELVHPPRGLAIGLAFAGVGIGSVTLLPWVQHMIEQTGWRTACTAMGILVLVVLAPINLLLRKRPEDIGPAAGRRRRAFGIVRASRYPTSSIPFGPRPTGPCGARSAPRGSGGCRSAISAGCTSGTRCRCTRPNICSTSASAPNVAVWALGVVSLLGIPGQIWLGHLSDRMGREWIWAISCLGFAICFAALIALAA